MNRSDMNAGTDSCQPEGTSAKRANSKPRPVAASASAVSVRPATATVARSRRFSARAANAGTAGARPTVPSNGATGISARMRPEPRTKADGTAISSTAANAAPARSAEKFSHAARPRPPARKPSLGLSSASIETSSDSRPTEPASALSVRIIAVAVMPPATAAARILVRSKSPGIAKGERGPAGTAAVPRTELSR